MTLILHIDTAVETGSISLAADGKLIRLLINDDQKDHAAWIHTAISSMINDTGYKLKDIAAVAVSNGPGSYTGLRIGLAAAKGICYALQVPLITIGTLDIMVKAALDTISSELRPDMGLLCPMIDARRMEVYTALYKMDLSVVLIPHAVEIDQNSFDEILAKHPVLFFGNGSLKLKNIITHTNAIFADLKYYGAAHMNEFSLQSYDKNEFSDVALTEPLYIKEFFDQSSFTKK